MASPVSTAVKHFFSTMSGAPALTGQVGAGIAWLDALLVTGFDNKALTSLVVAAGVATASFSGTHSAIVDSVIEIAGVSGGPSGFAGLNGEQKVTGRPSSGSLTFATALPDGTYTGSATIKMASLGWSKVFTGTNKAVYRSADPTANGMYLRVDDSTTISMRVIGYEAMIDVDTGTGPFPTSAQISGGAYWHKSTVATAAAVAWAFAGDSRTFYHSICSASSQNPAFGIGTLWGFGDQIALRPSGDAYASFLNGSSNSLAVAVDACLGNNLLAQSVVPRAFTGLGSAVMGYATYWGCSSAVTGYSGVTAFQGPFPNPVDGAMYLSRKFWTPATGAIQPRGEYPGLYNVLQSGLWDSFKMGDRAPGSGIVTGRNLVAFPCVGSTGTSKTTAASSSNAGIIFLDATGPWR